MTPQGSHVEVRMQNIGENVTFPTVYEDFPYIKAYQFNHWTRVFNTFFLIKDVRASFQDENISALQVKRWSQVEVK